jgi:hypothetical protein
MDYHEHMKQYYDRLASEYEQNEAYREEPSEDLPGLFHAISLLPRQGCSTSRAAPGS